MIEQRSCRHLFAILPDFEVKPSPAFSGVPDLLQGQNLAYSHSSAFFWIAGSARDYLNAPN